jgi:hypothetical protein
MLGALRTPPDFNNKQYLDENGLHRSYRYPEPVAENVTRGYDNPFFVVNDHANQQGVNRAYGNIDLRFSPKQWLDFRYILGGDYYTDHRLEALPFSSSDYPTGRVTSADFTNYSLDHNLTGTARFNLTNELDGTFTLGQNLNSRRFRQLFVAGFDLVAPEPFQLDNTVTRDPDEFTSLVHVESYFGQAELAWRNQLFVTLAARNDGFSTFGASEQRVGVQPDLQSQSRGPVQLRQGSRCVWSNRPPTRGVYHDPGVLSGKPLRRWLGADAGADL